MADVGEIMGHLDAALAELDGWYGQPTTSLEPRRDSAEAHIKAAREGYYDLLLNDIDGARSEAAHDPCYHDHYFEPFKRLAEHVADYLYPAANTEQEGE